jgi:F-type H+-transporting ATPase subunit epsilon
MEEKIFLLEIITPSRICYNNNVKSVSVPGTDGEFQVLFNHAPILSTFEIGKIKVQVDDNTLISFATSGGTIEVLENKVLILAQSLERSNEIDCDRAIRAVDRAKKRLSESERGKIDITRAEISLAKAVNRLKIAGKNF